MSPNVASPPPTSDLLDSLDDSKISRFQIKIMYVSGMGFFTDAYDLFVIGIVVYLLKSQWHLDTSQVSLLNSITLAASAVGALVFGRVADILGRKRIYGYEVLILAIGAIASQHADLLVLGTRDARRSRAWCSVRSASAAPPPAR